MTSARARWIERGQGMPVVLLHGLGGEVGFWTTETESLARHLPARARLEKRKDPYPG